MRKEILNPVLRDPKSKNIYPVWDENSKILMIGSMTSRDGLEKGFYYASSRNNLWKLMDFCLGIEDNGFLILKNELKENFESYKKNLDLEKFEKNRSLIQNKFRKLLLKKNIAMCDIFDYCYANNDSSLDMDFILNDPLKYPFKTMKNELQEIISNSSIHTVLVNSKAVESWFKQMKIKGDYNLIYIPSPSPRHAISYKQRVEEWQRVFKNLM